MRICVETGPQRVEERVDGTDNWNLQCAFVTLGEKEGVKGGGGRATV